MKVFPIGLRSRSRNCRRNNLGRRRSGFGNRSNGGGNAHFDFPTGGQHDWGNWAAQLGAMSGDLAGAIA